MRKFVSLAAAAALLAGSVVVPKAAEARPGYRHHHGGYHAYRGHGPRYYRHRRGNAGAAAALGVAGALIGGAIAAQQRPHYGYGYGAYGPPPPPAYGYYGY